MLTNLTRCGCAILALALGAFRTPAAASDEIIHAGTLIDGLTTTPKHDQSVFIHDDRIVAIKDGFQAPPGYTVINLEHSTVMPGFIDVHVHMGLMLPGEKNAIEELVTETALSRAFDAVPNARNLLLSGFTSVRDVGGGDETVALRNAITAGQVEGPRMWVALEPLSPTGGHYDLRNGLNPELNETGWANAIVDSADEARFQVRKHKQRGANLIKLMVSGGVGSVGDNPNNQLMTDEEIRSAVTTAHSLGMKVAVHDYPDGAIANAVRDGVDSIEHGTYASPDTLALMKERGTYLVPTLTVCEVYLEVAIKHPELLNPGEAAKEKEVDPQCKDVVPRAIKAGTKIALGTDIGEGDHNMEFGLLIKAGMTPMDAILAGTRNAADLIGVPESIGAISSGHFADIVAVDGDPLTDASLFERVTFVMKGGHIYRSGGVPTNDTSK
jgi:imidazolonepropionase-like amidohydrolase